jgi:NADPH:quinone reductase-like Zn-dependent oxidoreductase
MDLWVRDGWPGIKLDYPHVLGADGAGIVDALGPSVESVAKGDRVVINPNLSCGECHYCLVGFDNQCESWRLLGEHISGTFREYIVIPATNALPLPDNFPFVDAAAAALVYQTAWHSLITRGGLKAGETVLIVGASGGVNTASIQIAGLAGAHTIVVGSSATKLELAKSLGAKEVIDRSQEDWSKAAYLMTGRRGVDIVVDNVGRGTIPLSLRAARTGGRILTVGNTGGPTYEIDHRYLFHKHLTIVGSTMGTRADFTKVMSLIFAGKLRPVVDQSYPLNEYDRALARLEAGEQMGKITLEI